MREVGLGGRPRDFEPRRLGADTLERSTGFPDPAILLVESVPQRLRALLRVADALALLVKRAHAGVEPRLGRGDAFVELGPAHTGAPEVLATCGEPRLELCARVFEPAHFDRERARPLDEGGVCRFGFRRPVRLRLHRLAGIEQPALRAIQLVVGLALIGLDPDDRLPRFILSRVLGALLFFSRASFDGDLLALPRDALRRAVGRSDLQVEADHGLFLPMLLALQRRRRRLRGRDPQVERDELFAHAVDGRRAARRRARAAP